MIDSNCRMVGYQRHPGINYHATRLKSGAVWRNTVTHQQRAEIFALPFGVSAPLIVIGDPALTELVLRFFVDDGNGMDGQCL
jgi:hypothetical protein